jgi:integrase/recombinase XerD
MLLETSASLKKFQSVMINERKSHNTIKEYLFIVSKFLEFAEKPADRIGMEDIERFKSHMVLDKNYSKSSQYLAIKALKHFFRSMSLDPPPNLTVPRRPMKMPNYLSEKETRGMLEAASIDPANRVIVLLLAHTGMRVSELCNLKTEDVDLDSSIIRIRSGKGDKDRIVLIPAEVSEELRPYYLERLTDRKCPYFLRSRRGSRFDTSTVERRIRQIASQAGIVRRVTPHVLRHTFATTILRNGGDIRFIQQLLGHASVATTQIYTHVDDESLKALYSKFRPRY